MKRTLQEMRSAPEFRLIEALFRADGAAAAAQFAGRPAIDAPRFGRMEGEAAIAGLAATWSRSFGVEAGIEVTPRFQTTASGRSTSEVAILLPAAVRLPIAVMGERASDGRLKEARIYHFEKAVTGEIGSRPSPFESRPTDRLGRAEDMPDINAAYFRAVSSWDIDATMAVFGDGAYVEVGVAHLGTREQLRTLYQHFYGIEVQLLFQTLTDDGTTLILEWTAGHVSRESGLAAYERDPAGKIGAIRMYDTFDPEIVQGLNLRPS